jgi:hypothetical protein
MSHNAPDPLNFVGIMLITSAFAGSETCHETDATYRNACESSFEGRTPLTHQIRQTMQGTAENEHEIGEFRGSKEGIVVLCVKVDVGGIEWDDRVPVDVELHGQALEEG